MKRLTFLFPALVLAAACSTSPISYTASTPTPQDGAYSCALRKVNELGFTVVNTDRQGGFITAEKQTSGLGTALLTGRKYTDALTVSIFDGADAQSRTIRVTAAQVTENAMGFGAASKTGIKPSPTGIKAAQEVLTACAPGSAPVQQTSATVFAVSGTLTD